MPRTSCTWGSVWRTKFLGEPPPRISTALLPPDRFAPRTIAAVSFTSRDTSILSLQPSMASAATFMPIELSPGDDVYTRTPCSHAPATSRGERPAQAHADGHVVLEHAAHEELRRFAQASAVVREQRAVDELADGGRAGHRAWVDPRPGQQPLHAAHATLRTILRRIFKSECA